jgi:hypothetical protein
MVGYPWETFGIIHRLGIWFMFYLVRYQVNEQQHVKEQRMPFRTIPSQFYARERESRDSIVGGGFIFRNRNG